MATQTAMDFMTGKINKKLQGQDEKNKDGYHRPRGVDGVTYRNQRKESALQDAGKIAKDLGAQDTLHHGGRHVKLDSFGHPVDATAPTGIDWLLANGSGRQSVKDRERQLQADYDKRMGKNQAPAQASPAPQMMPKSPEIQDNVKAPLDFFGSGDSFGPAQGQMKSQNGGGMPKAAQVQTPDQPKPQTRQPMTGNLLPQGIWPKIRHGANMLGGALGDQVSELWSGQPGHGLEDAINASQTEQRGQPQPAQGNGPRAVNQIPAPGLRQGMEFLKHPYAPGLNEAVQGASQMKPYAPGLNEMLQQLYAKPKFAGPSQTPFGFLNH